jgi:hypothetical protein
MPTFILELLKLGLGPIANAALGKGADWVKEKTGIDVSAPERLSVEQLTQLKQFELEHEEELIGYQVENNKISAGIEAEYLKDVQNARSMQIAAINKGGFAQYFIYGMATFWSLVAAAYIYMVTFTTIPTDNVRFADTIMGFLLGTVVSQILNFYFGSSRSSQAKDKVIEDAVKSLGEP